MSLTANPLVGAWRDASALGPIASVKILRLKAQKKRRNPKLRREILRSKGSLPDFGFGISHFGFQAPSQDLHRKDAKSARNLFPEPPLRPSRLCGENFLPLSPIDWLCDPITGLSWNKQAAAIRKSSDIKHVWELNRCQHLTTLSQRYAVTKSKKIAREVKAQLLSWIEQNPFGEGVNWASPLEIGIRLISWCLALQLLRDAKGFRKEDWNRIVQSILQQARFLEVNLSLDKVVRCNHLIGELAGLITVGACFPHFVESDRWVREGLAHFVEEIYAQTFGDGGSKEHSVTYHRFVVDFILIVRLMIKDSHPTERGLLERKLEPMLEYLMWAIQPDWNMPHLGDCDDGRGIKLSETTDFLDCRGWLAAGGVILHRGDFKTVAGDFNEEARWLLGDEGAGQFQSLDPEPPEPGLKIFPESGHAVIRSGWDAHADYLFIRCGPFGLGGDYHASHSHCDMLSPILFVAGQPILSDSGTFVYNSDLAWRKLFRGTGAHNTITVEGIEQATFYDTFKWVGVPESKWLRWEESNDRILLAGESIYKPGVRITRWITYRPGGRTWRFEDRVEALKKNLQDRKGMWFFNLASGSVNIQNRSDRIIAEVKGARITFRSSANMSVAVREGWMSRSFGQKQPIRKLILSLESNNPDKELEWTVEPT